VILGGLAKLVSPRLARYLVREVITYLGYNTCCLVSCVSLWVIRSYSHDLDGSRCQVEGSGFFRISFASLPLMLEDWSSLWQHV